MAPGACSAREEAGAIRQLADRVASRKGLLHKDSRCFFGLFAGLVLAPEALGACLPTSRGGLADRTSSQKRIAGKGLRRGRRPSLGMVQNRPFLGNSTDRPR